MKYASKLLLLGLCLVLLGFTAQRDKKQKQQTKKPIRNGFIVKVDKEKRIQELKENDPIAYKVTQQEGTEAPHTNEYNKEYREGIYVDRVTMRPLFSSQHKYDSGSGWPAFYDLLEPENIETRIDRKLFIKRTEVHSIDNTHLGHVFPDGPKDKTGLRYCINSKSLIFIPKEELDDPKYEGQYKQYLSLFDAKLNK